MRKTILLSLLSFAVLSVGFSDAGWAQSSTDVDKLEKRIQILEQLVNRLQEQLASQAEPAESVAAATPVSSAVASPAAQAVSADPTPPTTRISGLLFGDYYAVASSHRDALEGRNGFWFRRIYLTFDHALSDQLDGRLRFEMASPGDFESNAKLQPLVKDAYLRWKFGGRHQAYVGLSGTPTWGLVESFWGYRALEKTLLDLQRMGSSRDLGVAFKGSFDSGKQFRYHFMLGNGSGTSFEVDKGKKVLYSLGYYPNHSWVLEFYGDYDDRPLSNRSTYQVFAGYRGERGRVGLQYAHQHRDRSDIKAESLDINGLSVFGVYKLSPRASLVGRYDRMFDPNPDGHKVSYIPFDPNAKSNFFLFGVDLKLHEQFSIMPNIELVRYDKLENGTRPGTDIIPRVTFFYHY